MKISVASISYNHEPYIETYIEGIMSQVRDLELAGHSLEVNLVFDCPTDRSVSLTKHLLIYNQLCRKFTRFDDGLFNFRLQGNSEINLISNSQNQGGPETLTTALYMCTGDVISYLETDDYYKPGKLIKSLNFMLENDLDGVHTEISAILPDGTWIERGWQNICRPQPEVIDFDTLAANNCVYTCTFMAKSELIRKAPTPATFATKFYHLGDYPLLLYLVHSGAKIGYLNEPLSVYREGIGINNGKRALTVEADAKVKDWAWKGCPVGGYFETY